jgi:hypothetical protein
VHWLEVTPFYVHEIALGFWERLSINKFGRYFEILIDADNQQFVEIPR